VSSTKAAGLSARDNLTPLLPQHTMPGFLHDEIVGEAVGHLDDRV